jgi:5-methylcytosine-specific restriction endonuclease McrA
MDKEILINLVEKGFSTYEISNEVNKSQTTVRYWMKKYNIKSSHPNKKNREGLPILNEKERCCFKCKEVKLVGEFYKKKSFNGYHSYCKNCLNEVAVERLQNIKKQCIEYKGGECVFCGYKNYYGALEFHHKNKKVKDFTIANSCMSFDKLKKELDKCELVCSNCHREVHAGLIKMPEFRK